MDKKDIFPTIKKSLSSYLSDEEGNITRNKIITVGSLAIIMSIIYSMDVFAKHSSHRSHSSHSSHSSGRGGGHYSHVSHVSHSSHVSYAAGGGGGSYNTGAITRSMPQSDSLLTQQQQATALAAQQQQAAALAAQQQQAAALAAQQQAAIQAMINNWGSIYNEAYFIKANPDVYQLCGNNSQALFNYFVNIGMSQGRIGCAEFNVQKYIQNNPDLLAKLGTDLKNYYLHYMNEGKAQGRIAR